MALAIEQMANDPEIPLGKLLRENIGTGCRSPFQYFLVGLDQEEYDYGIPHKFFALEEFLESFMREG